MFYVARGYQFDGEFHCYVVFYESPIDTSSCNRSVLRIYLGDEE